MHVVAMVVVLAAVPGSAPGAAPLPAPLPAPSPPGGAAPTYRRPVAGPTTDPFRAPATRFGAGNRGIDFATTPGEPVVAAAAGTVTFAGQVAGTLTVVILHADHLRTSY